MSEELFEPWFHSMVFPDGKRTSGHKTSDVLASEWSVIASQVKLTDKSILDIGAWDGFFSFEAEKAGASKVTSSDYYCWISEGMGSKRHFDFAKKQFQSNVNELLCKPEDIPLDPDSYDVIFLLGVTYHVRNPIALLNRCSILAKELVVVETEYKLDETNEPILYLILGDELAGDSTNWNVPNYAGAIGMLQAAGLQNIRAIKHPTLPNSRLFLFAEPREKELLP